MRFCFASGRSLQNLISPNGCQNDASINSYFKKAEKEKNMETKKKKLIFRIILCVVSAALLTVAALYIIYMVKYHYPDYVSAWRQTTQSANTSFPENMEFFRNGSCTVNGSEAKYKFTKTSVRIGDVDYSVVYDVNQMTLSNTSGSAVYESTGSSERYDYHIENGGAVIERYNGYQKTLVVPDELGGAPVTRIVSIHNHHLVSLTIPDGVTKIDPRAFWLNTAMEDITLPQTLSEISERTFEECSALKHITVPEGIVSIGDHAFADCTALELVDLPESLRTIGESAFVFCPMLRSISTPLGVTDISDSAFQNCVALESFTLPDGLKSLGSQAFYNCASLKEIVLPESLLSLGSTVFYNCSSLEKVVLTGSISVLDSSLFDSCSALKRVVIPNGVTTIDDYAFSHCPALKNVQIPKSVTNISTKAFLACSHLAGLTIVADNPTYICRNNALLSADGKTFYCYLDGSQNSLYTIPAGVETIETGAFLNCEYIQRVIIPEGVQKIAFNSFDGCTALESLSFPASVEDCSYAVTACYSLNDVIMSPLNPKYSVCNGLLLNENGLYLYNCFYGAKDGVLVLPEGIAHIFGNPYENIADLKSVWLPKSLIDIGLERGNSALGSESYLKQNDITVYAWRGSDAYKAAKKYGIPVVQRKE